LALRGSLLTVKSEPAGASIRLAPKRGQTCRTLESRTGLYHTIRTFGQRGLSYAEMQKRLYEDTGTHLSKASISYWLRGIHHPSGSLNRFRPEPSPELSYVIGVALSDGNINVHEYHREILLSVTDRDFAAEFSRCLGRVLGREHPYKVRGSEKRDRWIVQGSSVLLHTFLNRNWNSLRKWIEHCEKCESAFLRAFYDGEGSITSKSSRSIIQIAKCYCTFKICSDTRISKRPDCT
jgi:intein-encoded DNA endonuclease-like protein